MAQFAVVICEPLRDVWRVKKMKLINKNRAMLDAECLAYCFYTARRMLSGVNSCCQNGK
jgi:hypothetical protein